jgi:hypothetical protein
MTSEPRVLHFEAERDEETESFQRADPTTALIEQRREHVWTVTLPDGNDTHSVVLIEESGEYVGRCTCDGFRFHDKPCAHLLTIRKAAVVPDTDVNGTPVRIQSVDDLDDDQQLADQHDDTERVRADGGRRRGERR